MKHEIKINEKIKINNNHDNIVGSSLLTSTTTLSLTSTTPLPTSNFTSNTYTNTIMRCVIYCCYCSKCDEMDLIASASHYRRSCIDFYYYLFFSMCC